MAQSAKKTEPADSKKPHQLTPKSFWSRRKRHGVERRVARTKIDYSFRIFNKAITTLWSHWELFGGITLVFGAVSILLVGSSIVGNGDLQSIKDNLSETNSGDVSQVGLGIALFGFLIQSSTSAASGAASAYQTVALVITSLATVWALRQVYMGNKVRVRDAFYNATYPLTQVLLVSLVVLLHLLPALLGTFLYNTLVLGGILLVAWQQVLVAVITVLLWSWTAYLVSASIFALYIVQLPDMTPLAALRSAKALVKHRRGTVIRKLLYLPFILAVIGAVVTMPFLVFLTSMAMIVFFPLSVLAIPVVHAYIYGLYRELIRS